MKLINPDRIEEILLVANENWSTLNRKWLYVLLGVIIFSIPLFFVFKGLFYQSLVGGYEAPQVTPHKPQLEALQVIDKKIFKIADNTYSGYVKIKNINLDWGVREQDYTAVFKTLGGTTVTQVAGKTFVLPASEKLIVFSRFTTDKEPSSIEFSLGESSFILKPSLPAVLLETSRVEMQNAQNEFIVSAQVKNLTAFIITQLYLPVVLYNSRNEIVGVNFTSINDIKSAETRSFQVIWPQAIPGVVRAEVIPQANILDPNIYETEAGRSQFDSFDRSELEQ